MISDLIALSITIWPYGLDYTSLNTSKRYALIDIIINRHDFDNQITAKANTHSKTKALLLLLWSIWFCREVFCFCREVFGFAVRYFVFAVRFLVLLWQLWATIQNRPFTASHSRGTKQPRWRAKVALWQDICTTWMSSCKGPIGCVRVCMVNKWCHQKYAQMRKSAHYVIQPTRELFVLAEVSCDIIYLFTTAALPT